MRKLAAGAGVLSLILFVLILALYEYIPQTIPVLRGIEADKSLFLSIRILVINILTLAAFLILAKSIYRSQQDYELNTYGTWILIFIMVKMLLEFVGLLYESFLNLQMYILLAGVVLLGFYGLSRHRYLFGKEFWKPIRFLASEKIILTILLITYIAVNIPVVSMISNQ